VNNRANGRLPAGKDINLDELDKQIIHLMLSGHSNVEMAAKTKKPLSTIQRRSRKIIEKELLLTNPRVNYKKFGYKNGLLHVYLKDGDASQIAQAIWELDGIILKVSVHIGNSDIIVEYACKDTQDLMNLISQIKKIGGIEKVVWSEEVFEIRTEKARAVIPRVPSD